MIPSSIIGRPYWTLTTIAMKLNKLDEEEKNTGAIKDLKNGFGWEWWHLCIVFIDLTVLDSKARTFVVVLLDGLLLGVFCINGNDSFPFPFACLWSSRFLRCSIEKICSDWEGGRPLQFMTKVPLFMVISYRSTKLANTRKKTNQRTNELKAIWQHLWIKQFFTSVSVCDTFTSAGQCLQSL